MLPLFALINNSSANNRALRDAWRSDDGAFLYLGSANWTGAGLGAKGAERRNFELGLVTDDEALLDEVQALYDGLWRGEPCARCRLREGCEMPLDVFASLAG